MVCQFVDNGLIVRGQWFASSHSTKNENPRRLSRQARKVVFARQRSFSSRQGVSEITIMRGKKIGPWVASLALMVAPLAHMVASLALMVASLALMIASLALMVASGAQVLLPTFIFPFFTFECWVAAAVDCSVERPGCTLVVSERRRMCSWFREFAPVYEATVRNFGNFFVSRLFCACT